MSSPGMQTPKTEYSRAPVLVASSLFSCTLLCTKVDLSQHPPSLGLCGLSSSFLCLFAGIVFTVAVVDSASLHHPPIWVVGESTFS
ncbi:hypothetical protein G5714_003201 [Onychostoma macrolepis]|uniref:Uncharacterized protein n=1 Tax=Onychostoma macrolepis TaxID=369639 RepID=A0A7J6D953_9TELE|nr:hypothetical protein G5714_003201 [Onychostoma macrolepis]